MQSGMTPLNVTVSWVFFCAILFEVVYIYLCVYMYIYICIFWLAYMLFDFHCSIRTLSCGVLELVPQPGTERAPPAL